MKICNFCGNKTINKSEVIYYDKLKNKKQIEYSERCSECGNLLYGYIRPMDKKPTGHLCVRYINDQKI